jgi:hypothetical protein
VSEADNVRRWPADRRGVAEVWYTTWNDPKTGQGFWLRFIHKSPAVGHPGPFGDAPFGELWFARFDPKDPTRSFGIHKRFSQVSISDAPFEITIAGCKQGNAHTFGDLSGNGHDVRWDLHWEPGETMRWYPDAFYKRPIAESTALSPNPRVPLSGTLLVDGEEIVFDRVTAGQSHTWGRKYSLTWLWAHCNEFAGAPDTTLEIVAGRMQKRGIALPVLGTISLILDGENISLNGLSNIVRNRLRWEVGSARFRGSSLTTRIEGEFTCTPEQMINAPYFDADGQALFCANTCIGSATLTVYKRSGLRWVEHRRLSCNGRAHFEVGSRSRDPRVTTPHVLVT